MKIATYNVNSIRQRLPIVLDWLSAHQPDVFCLQETKVIDADFPVDAIREAGYHASYRGMKGYNGVATLTRDIPERVVHGLHEGPDNEDFRIIQTVVRGIPIVNTYVPQGQSITSEKYIYKLTWYRKLRAYFEAAYQPTDSLVWLGDLNVAPEPIDVYRPAERVNDPDFHLETRLAFQHVKAWGFTDTFRHLHPDAIQYTYWDYFRNAFARNNGWRIDHILVTAPLAARCVKVEVDMAVRALKNTSDHTILSAEFDL